LLFRFLFPSYTTIYIYQWIRHLSTLYMVKTYRVCLRLVPLIYYIYITACYKNSTRIRLLIAGALMLLWVTEWVYWIKCLWFEFWFSHIDISSFFLYWNQNNNSTV